MKQCIRCVNTFDLSSFDRDKSRKDGHCPYCKTCSGMLKQASAKRNPEKHKAVKKREKLKARYGLTEEEQLTIAKNQNFTCAIAGCSSQLKMDKDTHTDHCHNSGKVRGLLCGPCNRALGLIKDNPIIANGMASYILENLNG